MADTITVTKEQRTLPTPGPVIGVCVDVVDLGEALIQYQQQDAYVARKAAIIYQIDELHPEFNTPFETSAEFTVSFGKKAGLRKWLASWRGKEYTDDEAAKGVPLHKLEGRSGIVTIEHRTSAAGNLYAKLTNITPLMKDMKPLAAQGYKRSDFWAKKKQDYADEVAKWRAGQAAPGAEWETVKQTVEDDDDLPF